MHKLKRNEPGIRPGNKYDGWSNFYHKRKPVIVQLSKDFINKILQKKKKIKKNTEMLITRGWNTRSMITRQ